MCRKSSIGLIIILVLLLVGCSHPDASQVGGVDPQGSRGASAGLLNFTAKTIDGNDFVGSSLLGKPAVLWFWAPWCPTCQMEAPDVEAKVGAFPRISFVGVAARDSIAAMQKFVDKYSLTFPQLADSDGLVWARFAIVRQPAFAFIHADGHVEVTHGVLEGDPFDAKLQTLAGEHP